MAQKNYKILLAESLAKAGHKRAMFDIAKHCLDNETEELTHEKGQLILRYLSEFAEDKDTPLYSKRYAKLLLGIMYYSGKGVEQNYKKAIEWYEKAAAESNSYALSNLGYCYFYGRDVPVDYEKAYSYFSQAAFWENPNAMYKLGDMYYDGLFVGEDKDAAFFWYSEAHNITESGDYDEQPNIEYRLGKCWLYGHGTEKNTLTALNFLQKSEINFFTQTEAGNKFARLTLPKVRNELDIARAEMYSRQTNT
ncbi:MAG: sel1 repeat family protein [Defluviitaleaceae bacterium]|nr:sel1 repeat family protein [Defluviitaleaceae bacterium]